MFKQALSWSGMGVLAALGFYVALSALILVPAFLSGARAARMLTVGIWLVTTGVLLTVFVQFRTVTIAIQDRELAVGFGAFRERVSLDRITACAVVPYRWTAWGGWGIRYGDNRKLYNVPGDGGVAVQVTHDDGSRLLFSSPDPAAVCQELQSRGVGRAPQ